MVITHYTAIHKFALVTHNMLIALSVTKYDNAV